MNSDVLIIGGGIIGLSIARELKKKGVRRITILDKGVAGREASWAAAGMLAPQAECDQIDPFYELCSASRDMFPTFARELRDETGMDIELDQTGTLYLAFTEEDVGEIRKRYEWQSKAGLAVDHLNRNECRSAERHISDRVKEGLFFPNDWQVETRKTVEALVEFARRNDIQVVANTLVTHLLRNGDRIIGVKTNDDELFHPEYIVMTTGAWTNLIQIGEDPLPFDVRPIRGQMICFAAEQIDLRHVLYSRRGYVVPRVDGRILAGATVEDVGFDRSKTAAAAEALQRFATEIAPEFAAAQITDHWTGLRPFANDGFPVIGTVTPYLNLFAATAHYRNGILLSPVTARSIAELIVDGRNDERISTFTTRRANSAFTSLG